MANFLYPSFLFAMATQAPGCSLVGAAVKAAFVAADYLPDPQVDRVLADVADAILASSDAALTGKSLNEQTAAFDSDDVAFGAVDAGPPAIAIILYFDTGDSSTSKLIAYFDEGVGGLPFVPGGGPVTINVATEGWFAL
jgi:hypothetical protein